MSTLWYYSAGGQKVGPISEDDVRGLIARGQVTGETLVWSSGPAWAPARTVAAFAGAFGESPRDSQPLTMEALPSYPIGRLVLFMILSFGMFAVPWSFRLWNYVNRRCGERNNAGLSAVFGTLMLYHLLKKLEPIAAKDGAPVSWNAGGLALAYFCLNATGRLPGYLSLLSLLSFVVPIIVQGELNKSAIGVLGHEGDAPSVKLGEWLSVVIGMLIFLVFAFASALQTQ